MLVIHSVVGHDCGVDHSFVLPVAVVTRGGDALVLEVAEVDGVLVERASGAVIDLVDLVVALGLPELVAA